MPKIRILTEELINKIAAGEVIERPASVVKELVENSLDAGATRVIIEIEDSGKKLIKVADNGEGMEPEDARNSVLRHATSKIKDAEDLFSITTLGFRGEALASIAAVSQLSLITKNKERLEGFNVVVEGSQVISSGILAAEQGTTIEVRNLFFNTPARKKFLKSDAVELRHIIEVVTHYALIHHRIAFRLLHDGHILINSPSAEDPRGKIASLYGTALAKELLEVGYQNGYASIKGFIAKPAHARNDKSQQTLLVNGRWVKNNDLLNAVYDAYHSLLFANKHPVLVLELEINPNKVDVNVHPTKSEIRLEQKKEVCQSVFEAVRETLRKNNLFPSFNEELEQQLTLGIARLERENAVEKEKVEMRENVGKVENQGYAFEPGNQTVFQVKEASGALGEYPAGGDFSGEEITLSGIAPEEETSVTPVSAPAPTSVLVSNSFLPAMRLLGQVHKTYFVAETLGGLVYIDQHAAHERILYEQFMKQYRRQEVKVQQLLQGEVLEFSPAETLAIREHQENLKSLGFALEEFGRNTFVIKTVPLIFGRLQPKEIIYEVLSLLKDGKQKLAETKEEIVTRMSCRSAVMAGDVLTIPEMEKLLDSLSQTQFPYTCPHGRPTIIRVPVAELEKKFKRK